jgi:5-methylcytosine-specific restriction endonuclease McrA
MSTYISTKLRQQVRTDAGRGCGYCLSSEILTGIPLEIEHIIPEARGGLTERENFVTNSKVTASGQKTR